MRKFTLLIASLFITIGAMAQVLTDGVYTIQADENGKRGYLAVAEGLERPVLTEISWDSYAQNSYADILENGKYWYLKTIEGMSFLYNVANGCFIVDDGTSDIFVKSDVASVLNIENYNTYIHVGSGTGIRYLSMGCGTTAPNQVKWETQSAGDGGCLLTFTAVENGTTTFATQIAAAAPIIDAAIEEYLNNWKQTAKNLVGYVGGYSYEQEAIIDAISTVAEKNEFENTAERLAISTSAYYRLVCVAPKTGNGGDVTYNTLTFNGESNLVTAPRDNSNENQIFTFEDAGDGKYYLKNKIADGYLNKINQGAYRSAIVAKEDACKLQLLAYNELQWELNNSEGAANHSLFAENHPSETVPYACAGWDDGANSASAWHIILAGDINSNEVAKAVLGETINTAMAYYEVLTIGKAVGEYTTSIEGFYDEMEQISVYYGNITESTPIEEIEAKTARVNEIIASFTPNMPVDGKAYTFKNVQKDGSVCWFKYDTENDNIGLTAAEEEATKFVCAKLENGKYTFTFDNGKYLIWRGSSAGNNDVKGYMDEYDETWAQLTIEKMTTGGQISADLTATRYVTINGRRHNNTADSNSFNYIVIKKDGPVFDQANVPFYNDNFSSAFIMDEVETVSTAIENVEVENAEQVIYDLTGRRVETITEPGIYIVGGKKVLVK